MCRVGHVRRGPSVSVECVASVLGTKHRGEGSDEKRRQKRSPYSSVHILLRSPIAKAASAYEGKNRFGFYRCCVQQISCVQVAEKEEDKALLEKGKPTLFLTILSF